jgi:DHA1 family bicyclomycin/chloramphenicol resistance-like MFS transporter
VLISAAGAIPINIFLPSLPAMANFFNVSYAKMQLSITVYLALTGAAQLIIGPISDRYGRRIVMLWTLTIFIFSAVGAALSTTFTSFMFFRCIQATSVAGYLISRTVVRDTSSRETAASLIGYVTMGMALAPMLAPAVGGWLGDHWGWQSNFHALALIGIITFVIVYFDLGETNKHKSDSFTAQFKAYPELLKSRRFWGYTLTLVFASGTFYAYLGGAPFVGESIFGLKPSEIGIYLAITPFGYMAGNGISGRYAHKIGMSRLLSFGPLIVIVAMFIAALLANAGATHPLSFFAFTFAIGLTNGLVLPSANAGLLDARPDLAGSASGLSGALMTSGGAILASLCGMFLTQESGVYPLIICIVLSAILCLLSAIFTIRLESKIRQDL